MEDAIKYISQTLVKEVGGIEAAASLTRLSKSRIHQCLSPNHPEDFLPIDVICALESYGNTGHFAKLLSQKADVGSNPKTDTHMTGHFVALSAYFGKVMEEYGVALEDDDVISANEAKTILKQALELQRAILGIEGNLLRIIADQ